MFEIKISTEIVPVLPSVKYILVCKKEIRFREMTTPAHSECDLRRVRGSKFNANLSYVTCARSFKCFVYM